MAVDYRQSWNMGQKETDARVNSRAADKPKLYEDISQECTTTEKLTS